MPTKETLKVGRYILPKKSNGATLRSEDGDGYENVT